MELFTSIHIEVSINDVWVDLTPDVCSDPYPSWNMGIMDNGPTDRVGDPEFFRFCLKNGESSSGGLGYYSPGHANALSGWTTGLNVRLYFVYDGKTFYKYYGKILPEGIEIAPGEKGRRIVKVSCHGFMGQASDHIFALPTLAENKRIDEAVPLVLANMPIQPLATSYDTGADTFPTVFDTVSKTTTALGEFQNLAMSELGYIYTIGDQSAGQTLKVESRTTRQSPSISLIPTASDESGFLLKANSATDYILMAGSATDHIILSLAQAADFSGKALISMRPPDYGRHLTNQVKAITYPREVDAAATTVLFSTTERIFLEANTTKENFVGSYRDPNGGATYINGKEMVALVSGTDYTMFANEDGTGTNLTASLTATATFGTEAVKYDIQNTGGTDGWVYLQARGKGIYVYDSVEVVFEDEDSQAIHGVQSLSLDLRYQNQAANGEAFATFFLNRLKSPSYHVSDYPMLANRDSVSMYEFLVGEPGTLTTITEDMNAINGNYFIQGYSASIVEGDYVIWSPVLKSAADNVGWILGTSALGDPDCVLGYEQFG